MSGLSHQQICHQHKPSPTPVANIDVFHLKIESKKDLKSRIINVYENNDSSKCLKSRVLSVLEEEKFNTPNIHAAMLKNFLQNLPEPLLIPGYKKIFNIITGKTKHGPTVHQISQNF